MALAGSSHGRASDASPSAALPRPIVHALAGAAGIVAVIVLAIAVRTSPFQDLDGSGSPGARPQEDAARPSAGATRDDDEPRPDPASKPSGSSRELRTRLSKEVRAGKIKDAIATLESLVAADPRSPEDADVRSDILELASKAGFAGGADAERLFELISARMGKRGPDVLYSLATTKGGSKAAERAVELLKQPEVRARATPATQIAFDLWRTKSCPDKAALLDRARADGDSRSLGWLMVMSRSCRMSKDPKLKEAMEAIKAR